MMASEGIGALLRGIREAAGLTREEQAALLQAAQGGKWFDRENLKRWETEKRLAAAVTARSLASVGDREGALRAVADARAAASRLDFVQGADTWFGYAPQKHHVHLSQAFTLMGRTREAYVEQESALALTKSPSVMTRALIAIDRAVCVRTDGDPATAADLAVSAWLQLPAAYRDGLVRSRVESLCRSLPGRPGSTLRDALTSR